MKNEKHRLNKSILKNTVSLYAMTIAKMVIPMATLPYLTRVLSVETYGTVSYVKTVMQYFQLLVDFGFIMSGTRDITVARQNSYRTNLENNCIFFARIIMGALGGVLVVCVTYVIPILRKNVLFSLLSYIPIFMTCFLFDYFFRGIEKMHIITERFVVMKLVSAFFTFLFIKSDADILLLPIIDIVATFIAVLLVLRELKKEKFKLCRIPLKNILTKIANSFVFFLNDISSTLLGVLSTLLVGICLSVEKVAYWNICLQMVGTIQGMYGALSNGIYPYMIAKRDIGLIKRIFKIFTPIVLCGCVFTFVFAEWALVIVGGAQYAQAKTVLQSLTPFLFLCFFEVFLGWPTLGAIGKVKENMATMAIAGILQLAGMAFLSATGTFSLLNLAFLRSGVEVIFVAMRAGVVWKYRKEFGICSKERDNQ